MKSTEYKAGMFIMKTNTVSGNYVIGKLIKKADDGSGRWKTEIYKNEGYFSQINGNNVVMVICPAILGGFSIVVCNNLPELLAKVM